MTAPTSSVYKYVAQVVRDYLAGYTDDDDVHHPGVLDTSIKVSTDVPARRPVKLVTITTASTNSDANVVLSRRRVVIRCYHADEWTAGDMAETVFAHMMSAYRVPHNWIRDVIVVGTPARFDDPDDSTPRFQMTLDVLLRATV